MQRRQFLKSAAAAVAASTGAAPAACSPPVPPGAPFQLAYAPHFGMFRNLAGKDLLDQLRFAADQGFQAWEDNGMRGRDREFQNRFAAEMERLGMTMGVFVAHDDAFGKANFSSGDGKARKKFLDDIRHSVELAQRVRAKWVTVVPGELDARKPLEYQTANVIDTLRAAAEICQPSGMTMVLEPLNPWVNHPNMFLQRIPQAFMICRAVNSPSCKILFDIYHQQITEGNLIGNIDRAWSEIGYFQVGDHPGRKEPTTGEIQYKRIFAHLKEKGFEGIVGMEHGNSKSGKEGELAVIQAYRQCDPPV
ncbi:MAG: xylose isomerase [Planctomycetota bacterium]|nr:MAG: xylose isomerase [Planctomycetota bacterium]